MGAEDELLAARDAYSRGDWRAAYDQFGRTHQAAELNTDDLHDLSSYGMAHRSPSHRTGNTQDGRG